MSEVTYFILYILQHNKGRHQPFWSDPLNPIFCLYLLFFLAGTLRSLPVQVRLLFVLAAAQVASKTGRKKIQQAERQTGMGGYDSRAAAAEPQP